MSESRLGGQLAELSSAQRDSAQQLSTRVEQLAQQLAGQEEQWQELRQQQKDAAACAGVQPRHAQEPPAAAVGLDRVEQLAEQVATGAAALQSLQAQVGVGSRGLAKWRAAVWRGAALGRGALRL